MPSKLPAVDPAPVTTERQSRSRQPNAAACASSRMARLFSFIVFILVGSLVYAAYGRALLRQTLQFRSGSRAASVRLSDMMSMGESASSDGRRRQLLVATLNGHLNSQHEHPDSQASFNDQHLPVPAYGALHTQALQLLQTATGALRSTESLLTHLSSMWLNEHAHGATQQAANTQSQGVEKGTSSISLEAMCQQALAISGQALTAVEDCIQKMCMYMPGCKEGHPLTDAALS